MIFKKYDVFISYAIEDKLTVAEPLTAELRKNGLKVFFAGTELGIGDDIREVIHTGLRESKFGVVILSPNYNRSWTLGELFNLFDKEVFEKRAVIFPVWHNISIMDVSREFPGLVNRYGLPTDKGIPFIAAEITRQVNRKIRKKRKRLMIRGMSVFGLILFSSLLFSGMQQVKRSKSPNRSVFFGLVKQQIEDFQQEIRSETMNTINNTNGEKVSPQRIVSKYRQYLQYGKGGRHLYSFKGHRIRLNSLTAIKNIGVVPEEAPYSMYSLMHPEAYRIRELEQKGDTAFLAEYILIEKDPMIYSIDTITQDNSNYIHVFVRFRNNIRAVRIKYQVRKSAVKSQKEQKISFCGFKPREEYVFENSTGKWNLLEIK